MARQDPGAGGRLLTRLCLCPQRVAVTWAEGGFFVRQGRVHLHAGLPEAVWGTRCFSCDRLSRARWCRLWARPYHPDCFVCAVCR